AAKSGDSKAVERALHASLKDVINQGATLYNRGDRYGCYRVYDGALRAIRPLLANHADLQKQIDEALAGVEQLPSPGHRAFALRDVLDTVRGKLGGTQPPVADKKIEKDKVDFATDKKAIQSTLWDRLGGEANVRKVVHEFVVTAGADPKVNITRDGKIKLDDKKVALLEQRVVEYLSSISGGPLSHTGKSIKEGHKGMAITDGEFDATAGHFVKALQKYGAKPAAIDALVKIVAGTRKDIVEAPGKNAKGKSKEGKLPPGTGKVSGKVTFSNG